MHSGVPRAMSFVGSNGPGQFLITQKKIKNKKGFKHLVEEQSHQLAHYEIS